MLHLTFLHPVNTAHTLTSMLYVLCTIENVFFNFFRVIIHNMFEINLLILIFSLFFNNQDKYLVLISQVQLQKVVGINML